MTLATISTATARAHQISRHHEQPRQSGVVHTNGGLRARCSCGWASDCYALHADTERAIEVHLRRMDRLDFDELIERSSVGAALRDVKERGIDAHLADLERAQARRRRRGATKDRPPKQSRTTEEAAFLRGFALATATLWRVHHDGQLVQWLLKENSLCLADFRDLDVDNDVAAIREALRSRGITDETAVQRRPREADNLHKTEQP